MQTSHAFERRLAMTSGTLSVRVCSERQLLEHGHCEGCRFSAALLKVRFHVAVMSFFFWIPKKDTRRPARCPFVSLSIGRL